MLGSRWVGCVSCVPRPRQRSFQCPIEGGCSGSTLWPRATRSSEPPRRLKGKAPTLGHCEPASFSCLLYPGAPAGSISPTRPGLGALGWGRGREGAGAGGHVASQECAGARAGRLQGTGRNTGQWAPDTARSGQSQRGGRGFPRRAGWERIAGGARGGLRTTGGRRRRMAPSPSVSEHGDPPPSPGRLHWLLLCFKSCTFAQLPQSSQTPPRICGSRAHSVTDGSE